LSQAELPAFDFVCIARSPAPPSLECLMESLVELARRIDRRVQNANRNIERRVQ